jgi:hypothetical protein
VTKRELLKALLLALDEEVVTESVVQILENQDGYSRDILEWLYVTSGPENATFGDVVDAFNKEHRRRFS